MKCAPIVVALAILSAVLPSRAAEPTPAKPATTTKAGALDPEREKKEQRLVDILRLMRKQPPPSPLETKNMQAEYQMLLGYFGGFDPRNPPKDPKQLEKAFGAAMIAQAEIVKRRDPALAGQMDEDTPVDTCREKQEEADDDLVALALAELLYRRGHKAFSKDMKALDVPLENMPYTISVVTATANTFRARAIGRTDMKGDVWEVDEAGTPKPVSDICAH